MTSHDYTSLVCPLTATTQTRWIHFASACRPFGMVNLSPDTTCEGDWGAAYVHTDQRIQSFNHVHAWQIAALPMMPTRGAAPVGTLLPEWEAFFDHREEKVVPGYHRVVLPVPGVEVEMTATRRVGFTRFTATREGPFQVNLDLGATLGPCEMGIASVTRSSDGSIGVCVTNLPTRRRPKPLSVYFHIEVDPVDATFYVWDQAGVLDATGSSESATLCLAIDKPLAAGQSLQIKAAMSYTGPEGARRNLSAELPNWDFDAVRADARAEWNRMLGRIRVDGPDECKNKKFYTDFFHALLGRRTVSDADGAYFDHTSEEPRVRHCALNPDGTPRHAHYNSDAMWGAQ